MTPITIDLFEYGFLLEACIPPRPIARTMFWQDAINKHYKNLDVDERQHLLDWLYKNDNFRNPPPHVGDSDRNLINHLKARYDKHAQYTVTADNGEVFQTYLLNGRYHTNTDSWVDPPRITSVQKTYAKD